MECCFGELQPDGCCPRKSICSLRVKVFLATSLLVSSIALGVVGPILLDDVIQSGIRDATVINGPGASGYEHFVNYSYESDSRFVVTFFNISNALEILQAPNVKPALVEIGPFVYNLNKVKHNVSFGNGTVTYRQHQRLEFNEQETLEATNGKYNSDSQVNITSVNLIFNGMRMQAGRSYWHLICDLLLWKDDFHRLFEQRTPKELVLGYSVSIKLPRLPPFPIQFPGLQPNLPLDKDPDMQNTSTQNTGASDIKHILEYVNWRGQTKVKVQCPYGSLHLPFDEQCKVAPHPCCGETEPVSVWDTALAHGEFDEDANAVQGGPGDQFSPGLHAELERATVFFDLAQRTLSLHTTPGEPYMDYFGVKVRPFRPDRILVWGNATERPANARYFQWGPGGLMNLTMVMSADVYVSLPHFLNCEQKLLDAVTGLNPDPSVHDNYLAVEPYTGMTIFAHNTAMVSAKVQREDRWFPTLENRTLFIPVAWFDERTLGTKDAVAQLSTMYTALHLKSALPWVGFAGGCVAAVWGIGLAVMCMRKRKTAPSVTNLGGGDGLLERGQPI